MPQPSLDRFLSSVTTHPTTCFIFRLKSVLDEENWEQLQSVIHSDVPPTKVTRALELFLEDIESDLHVPVNSVANHRKGKCSCRE